MRSRLRSDSEEFVQWWKDSVTRESVEGQKHTNGGSVDVQRSKTENLSEEIRGASTAHEGYVVRATNSVTPVFY